MRDVGRLEVWHKARSLALDVYALTRAFPDDERFGLTSQSRRAAVSVAANVAEGCGRGTQGDFLRFLRIASGSAAELETLLILGQDLGYPENESVLAECVGVRQMLTALIIKISGDARRSP